MTTWKKGENENLETTKAKILEIIYLQSREHGLLSCGEVDNE